MVVNASTKTANKVMDPSEKFRHLLRALLRQCTYLPDPAARQYMHRHILSRYREYSPRPSRHDPSATPPSPILKVRPNRRMVLLRTAQDGLSLLDRANSGHLRSLTKVLAFTYGRTGKRRYELLHPLLAPETPSDQVAVASLSASLTTTTTLTVPPKLEALIKSHIHNKQMGLVKLPIKQIEPRIPATNIWRRSVPMNRVRNIEKRWLKMILERVMPPLPEEEWERLRDLANGTLRWEGPVHRRVRARQTEDTGETEETEETDGISNTEGESLLKDLDEAMVSRNRRATDFHHINARFMKRLWASVFQQCPLMTWNAIRKTWHFEWGSLRTASFTGESAPDHSQWAAFQGVDEDGRVHRPKKGLGTLKEAKRLPS